MTIEDPTILLVDDLDSAVELMRTVFARVGYAQTLRVARDGEQAIAYLQGDSGSDNYKLSGMPTAVLLDLNMPKKDGFEVLEWIRQQPSLNQLWVCILSASSQPEDIARAYDLGANAYLVKPANLAGLMHQASCLLAWLKLIHFAPVDNFIYEDAIQPATANGSGGSHLRAPEAPERRTDVGSS